MAKLGKGGGAPRGNTNASGAHHAGSLLHSGIHVVKNLPYNVKVAASHAVGYKAFTPANAIKMEKMLKEHSSTKGKQLSAAHSKVLDTAMKTAKPLKYR